MAKSQGFILPFTGRLGKTTTGYRAGRYISRVIPDVKPSGKPTESQKEQRLIFGRLGEVMSAFNSALQMGLNNVNPTYGYQQGMKRNFDACSFNGGGEVIIDYTVIELAKGHVDEVSFTAPSFAETNTVEVAFAGNTDFPNAKSTDQVYIVAYDPKQNRALVSSPVLRTATKATLATPLGWNGATVHVYGFTVRNRREVSNSAYIGTGTIN